MKFRGIIFGVLIIGFALGAKNEITVSLDKGIETIDKNIYGHFAEHLGNCIYGGFWVGEDSPISNTRGIRNDVVEALKEIDPPVIRWPGGCFADYYHWEDGIGPRESRPKMVNSTWGGVTEDNSFGTHEFLDLCGLLGADPYLCVNVGSGTVQEARDWVEYVNSSNVSPMTDLRKANGREKPWNVKYWAVGNESWGCGGNMRPEYYLDNFKRYSTFMMSGDLYRIASGGIDPDTNWTRVLLKGTKDYRHLISGYSFHYYTVCHTWAEKGSATDFNEKDWFLTLQKTKFMEKRLEDHIAIMDEEDPENRVALIADEWGNWFDVEPGTNPGFLRQQNTLRDAVTAGLYLNIFNNHARRVKMANIAQTINVLQAMLLTKDDQMVKTPTFYVFKMYKVHQDATLLPIKLECEEYKIGDEAIPSVSASASKDKDGKVHISLCNMNPNAAVKLDIKLDGTEKITKTSGNIITADKMNAYNDFGKSEEVTLKKFNDFKLKKNQLSINLPSKSVVTIELD